MKKTIFVAAIAAVMMIGTAAAQPQRPQGEKREKPTPEQMAKFSAERMARELELTPEQQQQIYDYNLARIKEASQKAQAARSDMEAARKNADEKMQKILTPEQYRKWGEMQKRRADMGRAQGQRGGWQGHGPQMGPGPKGGHNAANAPAHRNHADKGKKHGKKGKCCKDGGKDKCTCGKGQKPAKK